jgi:hypothetical protein
METAVEVTDGGSVDEEAVGWGTTGAGAATGGFAAGGAPKANPVDGAAEASAAFGAGAKLKPEKAGLGAAAGGDAIAPLLVAGGKDVSVGVFPNADEGVAADPGGAALANPENIDGLAGEGGTGGFVVNEGAAGAPKEGTAGAAKLKADVDGAAAAPKPEKPPKGEGDGGGWVDEAAKAGAYEDQRSIRGEVGTHRRIAASKAFPFWHSANSASQSKPSLIEQSARL